MERDFARELWSKAPQSGLQFSMFVGDYDSTTLADIKKQSHLWCGEMVECCSRQEIPEF